LAGGDIQEDRHLKQIIIAAAAALALTACTTAEKTATGTGVGALAGAAIGNSLGGAVVGAVIGGFGTYLLETADGKCQYRNSQGQVYTTNCHWK
jgi:NhaP-type Na+/H+ or K+/H+ antiporter